MNRPEVGSFLITDSAKREDFVGAMTILRSGLDVLIGRYYEGSGYNEYAKLELGRFKKTMHTEMLPEQDRRLVEELFEGPVDEVSKVYKINDIAAEIGTPSDFQCPKIYDFVTRRYVLGIAARKYLVRCLEDPRFDGHRQDRGDIHGHYWFEVGHVTHMEYVALTGKTTYLGETPWQTFNKDLQKKKINVWRKP